jgi:hypothetical protein
VAARRGIVTHEQFETEIRPQLVELVKPGTIVDWIMRGKLLSVRLDYGDVPINAHIDSLGNALIEPPERKNLPDVCRACDQLEHDETVAIVNSPTYAWRHLGLVEPDGTPTARGMIFSFFHGGEGLAVAVALENETYPIDELVFDLANIRAGPRFAGEDAPTGGRLGILCQRVYRRADYPGYLTMGVPVQYGAGASKWCARWWLIRGQSTSSQTNCCVMAISNARWWSGAAFFATSFLRRHIRCRGGRN